ncbi:uncharacterized protein PG986_012638 [Apiospora aurea]|uniref:Secreted protein n=1 Tax=Apiospora aurea TaxID=335848 RepID=A0ABR1Q0K0_9PEZI
MAICSAARSLIVLLAAARLAYRKEPSKPTRSVGPGPKEKLGCFPSLPGSSSASYNKSAALATILPCVPHRISHLSVGVAHVSSIGVPVLPNPHQPPRAASSDSLAQSSTLFNHQPQTDLPTFLTLTTTPVGDIIFLREQIPPDQASAFFSTSR